MRLSLSAISPCPFCMLFFTFSGSSKFVASYSYSKGKVPEVKEVKDAVDTCKSNSKAAIATGVGGFCNVKVIRARRWLVSFQIKALLRSFFTCMLEKLHQLREESQSHGAYSTWGKKVKCFGVVLKQRP